MYSQVGPSGMESRRGRRFCSLKWVPARAIKVNFPIQVAAMVAWIGPEKFMALRQLEAGLGIVWWDVWS